MSGRIAGLGLLCGLILCGCGAEDGLSVDGSLSEAEKSDAFRVYYAGERVAGLPLEGVEGRKDGQSIGWNFCYGDCDPPVVFSSRALWAPPSDPQLQHLPSLGRIAPSKTPAVRLPGG